MKLLVTKTTYTPPYALRNVAALANQFHCEFEVQKEDDDITSIIIIKSPELTDDEFGNIAEILDMGGVIVKLIDENDMADFILIDEDEEWYEQQKKQIQELGKQIEQTLQKINQIKQKRKQALKALEQHSQECEQYEQQLNQIHQKIEDKKHEQLVKEFDQQHIERQIKKNTHHDT